MELLIIFTWVIIVGERSFRIPEHDSSDEKSRIEDRGVSQTETKHRSCNHFNCRSGSVLNLVCVQVGSACKAKKGG